MSEEKYKICPVCGGRMLKDGSAWLCTNCEAILYEDRAVMPIVNDLADQPTEATFWCKFRAEAAKDIFVGIYNPLIAPCKEQVRNAIACADELIRLLKDGKEV